MGNVHKEPHPETMCDWQSCRKPYKVHVVVNNDALHWCPDSTGRTFKRYDAITRTKRASSSFSTIEVEWLADVLAKMRVVGADLTRLSRHPASTSIARKTQSMRASIGRRRAARASEKPEAAE